MTGIRPRGLSFQEFIAKFKSKSSDWYGDSLSGIWVCEEGHEILPLQIRRIYNKLWKGKCFRCTKEMFYEELSQ